VRLRLLIAAAVALVAVALAAGGIAMAQGTGSDDRDERLSGAAAERAGAAALEAVGSGRVTAVERDSDNAYEVEVTKPDGSTVDVELDRALRVVERDVDEGPGGAEDESRDDAAGADELDDDSGEDRDGD
jgi:uncharacterized membrane protein YkoI